MKIEATILFYVKPNHPDFGCVEDPTQEMSITDVYTFDDDLYTYHDAKNFIRRDLGQVAAGGTTKRWKDCIRDVRFDFRRLT